jgi:hypothetical protein
MYSHLSLLAKGAVNWLNAINSGVLQSQSLIGCCDRGWLPYLLTSAISNWLDYLELCLAAPSHI